ncbi:MAG: hypothetical protein O9972_15645 [Burkholderiales bacterium]|jgi:hypothetical protein|nr:hypothetical protein [Burkholderiales bacterium]
MIADADAKNRAAETLLLNCPAIEIAPSPVAMRRLRAAPSPVCHRARAGSRPRRDNPSGAHRAEIKAKQAEMRRIKRFGRTQPNSLDKNHFNLAVSSGFALAAAQRRIFRLFPGVARK